MLDRTELNHSGRRRTADMVPVLLALATSVFFGVVVWLLNRELLWMLAVLLPPIWTPVIVRRFENEHPQALRRVAGVGLIAGLVVLLVVLVAVFVLS